MTIFSEFGSRDVTGVKSTEITTGLWSPDETGSLSTIHTSSVQIATSGEYYYDIYNLTTTDTDAEVQFAIAYGHVLGSGSPALSPSILGGNSLLPTQVIYSQYKNILLSSGSKFTFGTTTVGLESDDIYVINISRARLKQSLDPGNWQLGLSGSNGISTFVDETVGDGTYTTVGNTVASTVFAVRSGSLTAGLANDTTIYGLVFPDYGAILLHPAAISTSIGLVTASLNARTATALPFAPFTGSGITTYQYQHEGLFRAISGSMRGGSALIARSAEEISSRNYFVRLHNSEYNYTNNPSCYTIGTDGTRQILEVFRENPLTYVTTIGLYTNTNELVAVAKLSRPIQKSEDREALIRVRLDY